MSITRIALENFTAFQDIDIEPSSGLNVFVGANGTGKTHLMKVAYAACSVQHTADHFGQLLVEHFMPFEGRPNRLVHRLGGGATGRVHVERGTRKLSAELTTKMRSIGKVRIDGLESWITDPVTSAFIPVKEMLANAPGFIALYQSREVAFERVYHDIIVRAMLPVPRGAPDKNRVRLLDRLRKAIDGKVNIEQETFFLKNKRGNLEFSLLAEGMRKLGLLWQLIRNGTLLDGSVLFWDEPEANLSPRLFALLVGILLDLQRLGVQVFVSTHDYAMLKEIELAARPGDDIRFFALYRPDGDAPIKCEASDRPFDLDHSPIAEAMKSLYDREIERSLGGRPAKSAPKVSKAAPKVSKAAPKVSKAPLRTPKPKRTK